MAKPNFPEKQTAWGTWEDLLLACAVHRYGSDSWDSVAAELRKRISSLSLHHLLTPLSCKQKYLDLRRRFASENAVVSPSAAIPFLDELRRLRVAELRREVERYDLSIVTLESKVEKLKEEREQSLREGDERAEKADLEEKNDADEENATPEIVPEKAVSGEGSVDESNSTNLKDDGVPAAKTGEEDADPSETDRPRECGKPPPPPAAVVEDSYDGSSDTIAKGSAAVSPAEKSGKVNSEKEGGGGGGGEVGGGDSAESKGGEEGAKEVCSSEMQCSTSLSRKKGEEPDEPDAEEEDQSIATRRAHRVESKSLGGFLEMLRSHKCGSFFERRQEIQKTPNYITMIRQHIDFEMVRFRLEEGWYSGCKSKFFRDVLLVLNNAIVFFGRKSPESRAAFELRLLVLKELAKRTTKQDSLPKEAQAPKSEVEEAEQPSDMLLRKSKLSVPMNACRKRSSITARAASTSSSGPERKKEQTSALLDVKPAMSWKQSDKSLERTEEFPSTKKKRKDRSRAGTKSNSNKSSATRSNAESNKNSGANSNAGLSTRGGTSNENSASKSDKKNNSSNANGKKQSAANFLNRMKRGLSSSLLETLKDSVNTRGAEQKKNGSSKVSNKQKEQTSSRKSSGGKQAKEQESPSKRSVGRPSKRPAAAAVATPPAKRSRQSVETEATVSRNAKKRSRK